MGIAVATLVCWLVVRLRVRLPRRVTQLAIRTLRGGQRQLILRSFELGVSLATLRAEANPDRNAGLDALICNTYREWYQDRLDRPT